MSQQSLGNLGHRNPVLVGLMLVGVANFFGCGDLKPSGGKVSPSSGSQSTASLQNLPAGETAEPSKVSLQLADWAGVTERIQAQKGKVVVVDAWSTACDPCIQEFPHLAGLQKRLPKDVVCISVSLDYFGGKANPVESYIQPVTDFVTKHHAAGMQHFLCTQPCDDVFPHLESASIPVVLVFDHLGKLRKRFNDDETPGFNYEKSVIPLVDELVKEAANSK